MTMVGLSAFHSSRTPFLPPAAVVKRSWLAVIGLGVSNMLCCRGFMEALGRIPLSLLHTIRAGAPLMTLPVAFVMFGTQPSWRSVLALLPIFVGFALATGAEPVFNAAGIACAVGSTACLVFVATLSRSLLDNGFNEMQVQFLRCSQAFLWLAPASIGTGGAERLFTALMSSNAFLGLMVLNGICDYLEDFAYTGACGKLPPVSHSVLDMLRRLMVVVVCGFCLHGNPCNAYNVLGAVIVVCGAIWHHLESHEECPEGKEAEE